MSCCIKTFKYLRFLNIGNTSILFLFKKLYICWYFEHVPCLFSRLDWQRYLLSTAFHSTFKITTPNTYSFGHIHNICFQLVDIMAFYDLPRARSFFPFWTHCLFPINFVVDFLYIFNYCLVCSLVLKVLLMLIHYI